MKILDIAIVGIVFVICLLGLKDVITNPFVLPVVCVVLAVYNIVNAVISFKKGNASRGKFLLITSILILILVTVKIIIAF